MTGQIVELSTGEIVLLFTHVVGARRKSVSRESVGRESVKAFYDLLTRIIRIYAVAFFHWKNLIRSLFPKDQRSALLSFLQLSYWCEYVSQEHLLGYSL